MQDRCEVFSEVLCIFSILKTHSKYDEPTSPDM